MKAKVKYTNKEIEVTNADLTNPWWDGSDGRLYNISELEIIPAKD